MGTIGDWLQAFGIAPGSGHTSHRGGTDVPPKKCLLRHRPALLVHGMHFLSFPRPRKYSHGSRGVTAERTTRPDRVILLPPFLCQDLHFQYRIKALAVEQLFPGLPVEGPPIPSIVYRKLELMEVFYGITAYTPGYTRF